MLASCVRAIIVISFLLSSTFPSAEGRPLLSFLLSTSKPDPTPTPTPTPLDTIRSYCLGLAPGTEVGRDGIILYAFGNGDDVQFVYIAYSPTHGIVVSYEGTNISSLASIGNDVQIFQTGLDARLLFLGNHAQVAIGFQKAWLRTADDVLRSVRQALRLYAGAPVLVTGHSLGGAMALLSAAYIARNLDVSAIRTVTFGAPRVGDSAFADGIDKYLVDLHRIVNYLDPVPHLPGAWSGYRHPSGEVWISKPTGDGVVSCAGQENGQCSNQVSAFAYDVRYHEGPYFGVTLGC